MEKKNKTKGIVICIVSVIIVIIIAAFCTLFITNRLKNNISSVSNNDEIKINNDQKNDDDTTDNSQIDLSQYELINITSTDFNSKSNNTGRYYITDLNITIDVIEKENSNDYYLSIENLKKEFSGLDLDIYKIDKYTIVQIDSINDDITSIFAYDEYGYERIINNEYEFNIIYPTSIKNNDTPSFNISFVANDDYPVGSNDFVNKDITQKYCNVADNVIITMKVICKNGILYYSIADTKCSNLDS